MASFMPNGAFGGPTSGAPQAATPSDGTNAPPTIDLNALASYVQQFQKQQQNASPNTTTANPPGLQEALAAIMKQQQQNQPQTGLNPNLNPNATIPNTAPSGDAAKEAPKDGAQKDGGDTPMANANDPQSLMEQISHLTKSLDEEKSKSKALQVRLHGCHDLHAWGCLHAWDSADDEKQEEKKREMKGFLNGIKEYVQSLDGVKDPNAKTKFMQVNH